MAGLPLKLMIPGPIQPAPEVMEAMGGPVQPHYGSEFTGFYKETIQLLKQVFNTDGDVFLMNGSGSVGLDACIGSALSTGEKILVGINGFFGERLVNIAEENGLVVIPVEAPWGLPLRPEDFGKALNAHPDAVAGAIVHLETSTTIVNPVQEIASIFRKAGKVFILDAVSSLGGLPFEMDRWGVDLCASASQKCLGAPPGLTPVAVGKRGWKVIDRNPRKAHGWYTNLRVWRQYAKDWGEWHPFPITIATNNVTALNTSMKQLLNEGIPNRLERYKKLAFQLRSGLRTIGYQPFTPDEVMAPVLTAAYAPDGVPSSKIVDYMANEYHIKISGGLGVLKERLFRIGHMSPTVSEVDIAEVLDALAAFKP
jgi:alanine-glyoxylate transaminase / serine-glyoxylate transaminase / serine-pyruvate transaminase